MITNQYTFNGDGQRVQIIDSQGTKKPIWDGENILLETDGADATQVVYTLEPAEYGNLVSQRRGSTPSTYLFDALGSTRKLTNSAGTVTDSYDFRAYGQPALTSGSTVNVFRWVGELGYYFDDDRDDYYLRARPYSPALARFLSQDPIGFEGSLWNLYLYANANPVLFTDPLGLAPGIPGRADPEWQKCKRKAQINFAKCNADVILCYLPICLTACKISCIFFPPSCPICHIACLVATIGTMGACAMLYQLDVANCDREFDKREREKERRRRKRLPRPGPRPAA